MARTRYTELTEEQKQARLASNRRWRDANPDKFNLSRIRNIEKLCREHPEYGFAVVRVHAESVVQ